MAYTVGNPEKFETFEIVWLTERTTCGLMS